MLRILDKRVNEDKGEIEYYVEWKPSHGRKYWKKTWEPISHLVHAKEAIDAFNQGGVQPKKKMKTTHDA